MSPEILKLAQLLAVVLILFLALVLLGLLNKYVCQFLWVCSGVNIPILKKCPNDYNKYANIGATIFFTALLAWLSMGYALSTVFNSFYSAILFGFIWSLMIFTLDRTIVSSMQKPNEDITFREFGFWREGIFALIRLGVAVIISLVITKPLEIKVFEDRLKVEIKNMGDDQAKLDSVASESIYNVSKLGVEAQQARTDRDNWDKKLGAEPPTEKYKNLKADLSQCNNALNQILKTNNTQISNNNNVIIQTRKESTISTEINGIPQEVITPEGRNKIDRLKQSNRELNGAISEQASKCRQLSAALRDERIRYDEEIKGKISDSEKRIEKRESEREAAKIQAVERAVQDSTIRAISFKGTLVTQIEALARLTDKDPTMRLVSLFIMLIFIAIETAPILAKLIAKRGDYDDLLGMEEFKTKARQQYAKIKIMSEMNRGEAELKAIDEKVRKVVEARENAFVEMSSQKTKLQLQKELENNEALFKLIAEAQKEIAELVVGQWKEQELQKLKNQRQSYTQTHSNGIP